jgi:hypothetical protein
MYTPKHLKKWISESNYGGEDLSAWYILIARTRDSDNLENSNFESIREFIKLQGYNINDNDVKEINNVLIAGFNHWACGWIDCLMIHENNEAALIVGDEIKEKLDNYPVFNEDDYQEREFTSYLNNCKEAVKEWLENENIEYDNELIKKVIQQDDNWDMHGEFYPDDDQIAAAYDTALHTKHCKVCNSDYMDYNACQCQVRMF